MRPRVLIALSGALRCPPGASESIAYVAIPSDFENSFRIASRGRTKTQELGCAVARRGAPALAPAGAASGAAATREWNSSYHSSAGSQPTAAMYSVMACRMQCAVTPANMCSYTLM